ncbi:50S ribosomal protein L13 [Candidatus Falkowbacteria bacterium RIFCSPLOWO2_12_FULL_45_13]|uniref:Large ribosomal subunit protein uL13 n=2 Tax=Candidatus Falkowiibacteriota TaxID=1752728 RepID=A0A1F5SCT4_9BACT|nr:MAG: 50S ribosomal protein L13 [Candidatus Falkowbacteria bacterium RIFCSPLOWO2_02_FULL_45_21]OGF31984.1 MAG: 50S ribosomal protein L13 [Candidatus Falkowbacteria bacterium RIFCSPLOWO2_12_FULL_45_13]
MKIERKLNKIDARGQAIGRLASRVALILRGKNKVEYLPYLDIGDIVEVSNIDQLKFSGKKMEQKKYHSYSGYPGGLKTKKMKNLSAAQILKKAVKDMLPKNSHRVNMLKRLIIISSKTGGNK